MSKVSSQKSVPQTAQMASAEMKARQLAFEEGQRLEEFEKQPEVKRKLEYLKDKADRL